MGDLNTVGLSGGSLPAVTKSVVLPSNTPIIGVQFATVQTDGYQMAFDDTFQSGAYVGKTDWTDTSLAWAVGDAQPSYDQSSQSINVFRGQSGTVVGGTSEGGGVVHPEVSPLIGSGSTPGGGEVGGLATSLCIPSAQGTVWAAIRMTGINVTFEMQLQILDTTTNPATVVANRYFVAPPGKTVEVVLDYKMGSLLAAGNPMYAQVIETGIVKGDSWTVKQFSFFDEAIYWEFSNDGGSNWYGTSNIRNDPYGILTFPSPGTNLQWRVTGYRPNLHVSALRVRPVYEGPSL